MLETSQASRRWMSGMFLMAAFWIPWLMFMSVMPVIRHAFDRIGAQPPEPTQFLIDAFNLRIITAWIIMAVGIAIPVSIPFVRPDNARRILTSAAVLLIICALSFSIPAIGVAVSAAATVAASSPAPEGAAPAP